MHKVVSFCGGDNLSALGLYSNKSPPSPPHLKGDFTLGLVYPVCTWIMKLITNDKEGSVLQQLWVSQALCGDCYRGFYMLLFIVFLIRNWHAFCIVSLKLAFPFFPVFSPQTICVFGSGTGYVWCSVHTKLCHQQQKIIYGTHTYNRTRLFTAPHPTVLTKAHRCS